MFNDYLDVHARYANSSESEVDELSEDDDGAVGNADVRAPDPLAAPLGPLGPLRLRQSRLQRRLTRLRCAEEGPCIQTLDPHYVSSMRMTNTTRIKSS